MNQRLPKNVIQLGGVREHRGRIKVDWGRRAPGKDGPPEIFRGAKEESRKNLSPMGNEKALLAAKEATVG